MWTLDVEKVKALLPPGESLPRIAVETGTARGNGAIALARHFEKVFTIELSEALFRQAKARLVDPKIECLHGNSVDRIPEVIGRLPAGEPLFFFLDAHWSGDVSVNWSKARWKGYGIDTAHLARAGQVPTGPEQCPLLDEMRVVMEHASGEVWLLIDDLKNVPESGAGLRDHEFPGEDWSHLSRAAIMSFIQRRLVAKYELREPEQWLLKLRAEPV